MRKSVWIIVVALSLVGCDSIFSLANQTSERALRHSVAISDIQIEVMLVSRASREFVQGNIEAVNELHDSRIALNRNFQLLRHGDPDAGFPPLPESMLFHLDAMEHTWANIEQFVQEMHDQADFMIEITEQVFEFTSSIPPLQKKSDQVAKQMLDTSGVSPDHIYIASRQLVLADRLLRRVGDMMAGGLNAQIAADLAARDAELVEKVFEALKYGDEELGVSRIEIESVRALLNDATDQFSVTQDALDAILDGFRMLHQLQRGADEIFLDSHFLVQQGRELMAEYSSRSNH